MCKYWIYDRSSLEATKAVQDSNNLVPISKEYLVLKGIP